MASLLRMGSAMAVLLVFAAQLSLVLASQFTSPAFMWSPHHHGMKKTIDYRTLSPRDLAKSLLTEGGWSNYLCSAGEAHQFQNFAFLFIGKELQSVDIARPTKADPALVGLLKDSLSNSSFSLAFPYVAAEEDEEAIESSLISEFANNCQDSPVINNMAIMGSCLVDAGNFIRLQDYQSVHNYMNSRMEADSIGHTNLIVVCQGGLSSMQGSDQPHSEGGTLSQLLNFVEELGAKYSFLYISDPTRHIKYPSQRGLERFLAEGTVGNGSLNSTACDGVCQIKSSLLEGIFVGIVLLVILISGLCCMAGIDTPTRFETPQDS